MEEQGTRICKNKLSFDPKITVSKEYKREIKLFMLNFKILFKIIKC